MIGRREPTPEEVLEPLGHVLVRTVAAGDHGPDAMDALLDLAWPTGSYSIGDWDRCLEKLDSSNLKVSTWLARRASSENQRS